MMICQDGLRTKHHLSIHSIEGVLNKRRLFRASQYDVTWPMLDSKQAKYQQNFSNPQGTVYITEGNGAVPATGPNSTLSFINASGPAWGRVHGTGGAYGIITTSSADKLTYVF